MRRLHVDRDVEAGVGGVVAVVHLGSNIYHSVITKFFHKQTFPEVALHVQGLFRVGSGGALSTKKRHIP